MDALHRKYEALLENLRGLGSAAIAFSGGVDSALLLHAAREALGERAIALTSASCLVPERELREAAAFCAARGIEQVTVENGVLRDPAFCANPENRCYICKRALFLRFVEIARERGLNAVAEGSNLDDEGDYRPGMAALRELGVRSPLRETGLRKAEIRALSREFGLPTWGKPSMACLASRFPYGEPLTEEKLARVERAEEFLRELGFRQYRVRAHGGVARIELPPEDFERLLAAREAVHARLRELGFGYACLDLLGYRTGSMNEGIERK